MGQIVNLSVDFNSLIHFADKALADGDALSCILNLNEARPLATTREEKHVLYTKYIKFFRHTGNMQASLDLVAQDIIVTADSDFFRMDFDIQHNGYYDDEEEEPDYEEAKRYATARNLIVERKYDEAIALFSDRIVNYACFDQVLEALTDAVACDKHCNLDKYLITLVRIMANSPSQPEMLQLLLEGGQRTHNVMVDSADYLLEEEDINNLCMMGIAYFQSNELAAAEKFFLKVLETNPIDEDSLYYMTAIGKLLKKPEYDKYWNRYKEVYKIINTPIMTFEKFFDSPDKTFLVPYLSLPVSFLEQVGTELLMSAPKGDFDEEYARKLYEFTILAPEGPAIAVIDALKYTPNKPVMEKTYLDILTAAKISPAIKEKVTDILINGGFEGNLCILTEKRVIYAVITKLHRRVSKIWERVYKSILRALPYSETHIPINCAALSAVIKKMDGIMALEKEDLAFGLTLAVINYLKKMRVNVDIWRVIKVLDIDSAAMDRGMTKFGLTSIYV